MRKKCPAASQRQTDDSESRASCLLLRFGVRSYSQLLLLLLAAAALLAAGAGVRRQLAVQQVASAAAAAATGTQGAVGDASRVASVDGAARLVQLRLERVPVRRLRRRAGGC